MTAVNADCWAPRPASTQTLRFGEIFSSPDTIGYLKEPQFICPDEGLWYYFKCVASNVYSGTTWISGGYWWLGAYLTCAASLYSWVEVAEWLHSRRKAATAITLISLRNVCLSHFKIPNIPSSLKTQRLRAKLLRNHFIPIAKMHFILQWENAAILGARMT